MAKLNIPAAPQVGVVTSRDLVLYRVKVFYPLLGIESEWIRVATLYAGQGWGLSVLPHTGNEVLVVFVNGDLNDGVVTGCLYSDHADIPPETDGELTLQHANGTALKLMASGDIELAGGGPAVARKGDAVACPCGTGQIIGGSGKITCG